MDKMSKDKEQEEKTMEKKFCARLFDELESLFPDTLAETGEKEYQVAGCNGTMAGVQVMLSGLTPGIPVSIEVKADHTAFKLFNLIPVPVEVNTGAKQRSAYLHNDVNDTLIRKAPFYVYEVLDPIYNLIIPTGVSAALAFKTPIEFVKEHRVDTFTFEITHGEHTETLTFKVEAFETTVQKPGRDTHFYINWINYDAIGRYHNVQRDTPLYDRMLSKYVRAAVYSRQNAINVPWQDYVKMDGNTHPVLDEKGLLHIINVLKKAGITFFEGGAFCGRYEGLGDDDDFDQMIEKEDIHNPDEITKIFRKKAFIAFDDGTDARLSLTGERIPSKEGEQHLGEIAKMLYDFVKKNDLQDVWTQCVMDEPNDALAPVYHLMSKIVHQNMPGIKVIEPVLPTRLVAGAIDILCPSADVYENDKAFYDEQVEKGAELYVYTCLTPGGNYLNRMLDMQRIRQVFLGWAPALYTNISGFLHWGLNQYPDGANPYARSTPMFSERVLEFHPKRDMFLPAGDFAILYPGYDMPLITTRSEAHRIGYEDLVLLQRLSKEDRENIMSPVFRGYKDYSKSIKAYRQARLELLKKAK